MKKKSITELAKNILSESMGNNVAPVGVDGSQNQASLRPMSKLTMSRQPNPGAPDIDDEVEEVDSAPVQIPPPATKKDTSASSQSRPGTAAGEQSPVQTPNSQVNENTDKLEISEELEMFIKQKIEEGLSDDEIAVAISEEFDVDGIITENQDQEEIQIDMSEHINALFSGENLSEEFKTKATTIFETAIKTQLQTEVKKIEQAYADTLAEQVEEIKEDLNSKVDDYLNYVVEQWVSENEVAIESGLRTEITEDFISGLKNLFTEHYIDIPEEKVSVVEELSKEIVELKQSLNEQITKNVSLTKTLNESVRNDIIRSATSGLTDTQSEKLKTLCENTEFNSVEDFTNRINTLKENYINSNSSKINNSKVLDNDIVDDKMISEETSTRMAKYAAALGRQTKITKK